jgi:hypothetical protein
MKGFGGHGRKVEKSFNKVSIWGRRRKKGAARKSSAVA